MAYTEEFYFPSRDGRTKIHAKKWIPESGEIKAVLQIAHGMVEHIGRYDEFASYLADKGFLVVGNDHLGHGDSIIIEKDRGFFCENDGTTVLVRDMHRLKKVIQEQYPEKPYFLLGHSMGSFFTRKYLIMYGKGIQGAIIMGTGNETELLLKLSKMLTKLIAFFRGWHYRSKLVNKLAVGNFGKKFKIEKDPTKSWFSRDEVNIKEYKKDPKNKFIFTVNAYYNMFDTIQYINQKSNLKKMPKDLPVFFVSGQDDPVGKYGKAVMEVYEQFRMLGMTDIMWKLYKDDRHEILNELDKEQVFKDIESWLNVKIAEINK
ncbi:alpha/beta fold hydrolase [Anaerosacchariphilus polymeriproducens]|uniref:Alpha/beta fold hydrolase n=1 Tax=Anaerosacchariphilus polymeriproducens TaxID=1812858 RepID=A0A371AZK8_9FIRM|nr:alpha/beta fold hydrolase [Anaerosacchariphilus polymeriproducens]RDU25048.1 alpha/beta fold hydrolase [Anaerosacchariphilus polymeriproducens]